MRSAFEFAGRTFRSEGAEFLDCAGPSKRVDAPPLAPVDHVIDRDHLARMTLGDGCLEREVLQLFEQQSGMLLHRMTSEAPKVVGALAHTLVGSARGVGAWKIAEAAEMIEDLARQPGPTTLTAAMNRLSSAVTEAQAVIEDMISAH
jgi:HPt (histidine-containing phosphotransfer) domain-containing protein